jgi:hypothetical protein
MARVAFDRDAVPISPLEARRMIAAGGFEILRSRSLFYFPRALARLRGIEPLLGLMPFGAQYAVLARRRYKSRVG